ncbi:MULTISPECIES: hypothetical protein [unclassified Halomonas]|uniref:hypothetical protein n=1 Tax=unclassified Halomonas TaxID=2609666 RepID=UPI002885E9B1|nr:MULTISPECIES: hypothetical protein [unclassified Halomonas]MDT0501905.1 hypothetical protein [Halomonas sp. PAR7]MDT0511006.1 hypothetical protein [Halomonas sp. LES1]MDT0592477.1 hypothetical protein [Halomonas sp. PAR8]
MTGTLVSPSPKEPLKAMGFYSFTVSIPNNDFYRFDPPGLKGHLFVASGSQFHHGIFYFIQNNIITISSGGKTDGITGELDGSTGTSGNTTVSVDVTNGGIYIENRSGDSIRLTVTLLAENIAVEH